MKDKRPVIGVTMGDPAGIGPEIAVKAVLKPEICRICKPVVIGDLAHLKRVAAQLGLKASFRAVSSPQEAKGKPGLVEVLDLKNVDAGTFRLGQVSIEGGRAAIQYIEKATECALNGEIDAVTTVPINKQAIQLAGSPYIGHTEMFGGLCGVEHPLMMFWVRGVRIFFLTRHVSLAEAVKAVKKKRIVDVVVEIMNALQHLGIKNPLVAVAALNPHASDEGLTGDEEAREISPAIQELRDKGFNVVGPVPADTVFHKALQSAYDAVLSLYHDQGHIAAKTVDFYGTVSVTFGLPFVRTSVDHGTAYDIAGKGLADPRSMEEALKLAAQLVSKR
jgi:4-hydroxythreonine-4-phosphate dehydrogenase